MASSELCDSCKRADQAGWSDEDYQSDRDIPSDLSDNEDLGREFDTPGVFDEGGLENDIWGSEDDDYDKEGADRFTSRRVRGAAYILMPTEKKFSISSPKPRYHADWKCSGKESKLVEVTKTGRLRSEYVIISKEMEKTIVQHDMYHFSKYNIIRIQKVINGCLWKQYLTRQRDIRNECGFVNQRMLFHGAKSAEDIAKHGFNEQYANISGMFGAGLYFAKHSSKANQYVFNSAKANGCPTHQNPSCTVCERQILLCRVTLGRTKTEFTKAGYAHAPPAHHSVTALPSKLPKGLKYPEYIVYRRDQVYPEFLITYTLQK